MLPLINSRRVELLDNPAMVLQFTNLVRKDPPTGRIRLSIRRMHMTIFVTLYRVFW